MKENSLRNSVVYQIIIRSQNADVMTVLTNKISFLRKSFLSCYFEFKVILIALDLLITMRIIQFFIDGLVY